MLHLAVVVPPQPDPDAVHARALALPDVPGLARYAANVADLSQEPIGVESPCAQAVLFLSLEDEAARPALFPELGAHVYRVRPYLQWDYERSWPAGERSPGFNRIAFVPRLPELSREEFARHWIYVHGPLARKHHPGIWRYAQSVVLDRLTPDAPDWDGFAELHFRSLDDFRNRYYDSDAGREILRADVAEFVDAARGQRLITSEHVLRG